MKKLLIATFILFFAVSAKTYQVQLINASNEALEAGTVVLGEDDSFHLLDENGQFSIEVEDLVNDYEFTISHSHYLDGPYSIDLSGEDVIETLVEFSAQYGEDIKRMSTENVRAGKYNAGSASSRTQIKNEDLSKVSSFLMNDALKAMQTMPGVAGGGGTFDSRMFIQGGSQWEWIAMVDNNVVLDPNRWGGGVSMFNPNWIESIDLYTAGYHAGFDQGLSGILDVQVKNGNLSNHEFKFELGTAAAEINAEGPLGKKTTYVANFRRTYYDLLAPYFADFDTDGVQFPYLMDGVFKVKHVINGKNNLEALAYGSREGMRWTFDNDNDSEESDGIAGSFHYINTIAIGSLTYNMLPNPQTEMNLTYGYQPYFSDDHFNGSSEPGLADSFNAEYDFSGKNDFHQVLFNLTDKNIKNHQLNAGVWLGRFASENELSVKSSAPEIEIVSGTNTNTMTPVTVPLFTIDEYTFERDFEGTSSEYSSFYAFDDYQIGKKLVVQPGLRYSRFWVTGEERMDYRAGLKYSMSENLDLHLKYGKYHFFPWDFTLLDKNEGNPDLQGEKADHYLISLDYDNSLYFIKSEAFYKDYHDLVSEDELLNYDNQGVKKIWGGDVYLQKKNSKTDWLSGWMTYTYVDGREKVLSRNPGNYSDDDKPLDEWFFPSQIRKHNISSIVEMKYHTKSENRWVSWLDGAKLSMDYRIQSYQALTPVTNVTRYDNYTNVSQLSSDEYAPLYTYQFGEYNSEYTPWTHKLDVKVTLPLKTWEPLKKRWDVQVKREMYLNLLNVYNHDNITSYSYTVDSEYDSLSKVDTATAQPVEVDGEVIYIQETQLGSEALKREEVRDLGFLVTFGMNYYF